MSVKNISATMLVMCAAALICLANSSCHEATAGEVSSDSQSGWYQLTCISLKQGNALKNARLRPSDNGTLHFEIQGEPLRGVQGAYALDGIRFNATIEFSVVKRKPYRYVLRLDGIRLFEAYAGVARLGEYIEGNRKTQEILFLFLAARPASKKPDTKLPFF